MIKRAPFVHTKGASFIIRGRKSNAPLQRRDAPKARPVKTGSLTETAGYALLKRLWERSGIVPLSACGCPFFMRPAPRGGALLRRTFSSLGSHLSATGLRGRFFLSGCTRHSELPLPNVTKPYRTASFVCFGPSFDSAEIFLYFSGVSPNME